MPCNPSQFTYKDLRDLNNPYTAYKSPLAVICHVDVNAFFAQCEQIRLNLTPDDPVVCLQWNSIIAVSYAARKYGISRMDSLQSAKEKCPNLIPAHTAVFKRGEPTWKYTTYKPSPINHKVSLDPYRRTSRKMMRIFQSFCDLVEKASVDESFMDFGRLVYRKLVETFKFDENCSGNDPLPPVPSKIPFEWQGVIIPVEGEKTPIISDWDDVAILIGSNLAQQIRQTLFKALKLTTSSGVGRVKTIAKLGSGYRKPNNQTVIRSKAIPAFLDKVSFRDFWSMGGKTGDLVESKLLNGVNENEQCSYIRDNYTLKDLTHKLGTELGDKVYRIVRGNYCDSLSPRIDIKTMASNKRFRNDVRSNSDLLPWFEVFVGDLILRVQDLDYEDEDRRPTKLTLKITTGRTTRSKQCTISPIKDYGEMSKKFKALAVKLLNELGKSTNLYPCARAALEIGTFQSVKGFNDVNRMLSNVKKRHIELPKKEKPVKREKAPAFHYQSRKGPGITNLLKSYICSKCGRTIPLSEKQEHSDYHYAKELQRE